MHILGMLDFKEIYLKANKHNHSYMMNQQITENFVLNISTSMTHCCRNNWWTSVNQVAYSPLFNMEQNFLKELMYPTSPGDGQTRNKKVGEELRIKEKWKKEGGGGKSHTNNLHKRTEQERANKK